MMRQIEIPKLSFTPWHAWERRKEIVSSDQPGIYLLAISAENLDGENPRWDDVSYIGMTNSQNGLLGRWRQFHNAIRGKRGHSGGNTVFGHNGHYDNWERKLFVAAMPVECDVTKRTEDDLIRMGWVAYLEYEAFAVFCQHCPKQRKPIYNTR